MTRRILVLSILTVFFGLNILATDGSRDREIREVGSFHSLVVNSGLDVYIVQGSTCVVEVEASQSILQRIVTEVKNNVLHVYVKGSIKWRFNEVKKVYISAPEWMSVAAGGGADIRGNSVIKGDLLRVESNGGADVYLSVDFKTLKLSCTGGADILMEGTVQKLIASASGGADIYAQKLEAKYVSASASGGGGVYVFASQSLKASASGGGDVYYIGSPDNIEVKESGGGDVSGH